MFGKTGRKRELDLDEAFGVANKIKSQFRKIVQVFDE